MILDGKIASESLILDIKEKVEKYRENGEILKLCVLQLVVDDASKAYLRGRMKMCEKVGVELEVYDCSNSSKEEVIELIKRLNNDKKVTGIMIDRPFPKGMDETEIFSYLDPKKDVDGCTIYNAGLLFQNKTCLIPSTAKAVLELMKFYNVELQGKRVVVVGRSKTVGAPVAQLLINQNATVTTCHSRTVDLPSECKKAEVLVVAIGKKEFIDEKYLNKDCVVVDVGIHYDEFGKMCGDVARSTYEFLTTYSPVPRGVGPLTNIALMQNLLIAKEM